MDVGEHPAGAVVVAQNGNRGHLSRLAKTGRALRLAPGLYAVGASLPPDRVVHHHRFAIIAFMWPGAVLSDRTAMSGSEPVDDWLFVTHPDPPRKTDLHTHGLSISPRIGPGPLPGDMPMPEGLYLSGTARCLVENVTTRGRPGTGRPRRYAGTEAVEDRIDQLARTGGAGAIRTALSQLDLIAANLPARAVEAVRQRLAAVLGTTCPRPPVSRKLEARLIGQPYDEQRLHMFGDLADVLLSVAPSARPAFGGAGRWTWQPFFEAYFSNFIEGTQFGVQEAVRIAIDGEEPPNRPKDAHDVAATYRIVSDPAMATMTASTGAELLALISEVHETLMAARPETSPGRFKTRPNYAGGYQFVTPDLLEGTLLRGFDAFAGVRDPFQRAVALMVLLTECHPFDDGNGRVARLVSNGVLSAAGEVRLIVPTIYRNNYLAGLAAVSNQAGRGESLVSILDFSQKWTASVDWSSFEAADRDLTATNAYTDAGVAEASGLRLRLPSH